jgi:cytoskeletal protein CcmA (bactofilin family)
MFGKSKDENDQMPSAVQQPQWPASAKSESLGSADQASSIGRGTTIVGKIVGEGAVQVFGNVEGELRALTVLIDEGAKVEGDIVAEQLTIGGRVKGVIHANRVKLNSTAVVEGDIFHRSLSIEENARFEGSSKREDNAAEAPLIPLKRQVVKETAKDDIQTRPAPVEGNRKSNGSPSHHEHSGVSAS